MFYAQFSANGWETSSALPLPKTFECSVDEETFEKRLRPAYDIQTEPRRTFLNRQWRTLQPIPFPLRRENSRFGIAKTNSRFYIKLIALKKNLRELVTDLSKATFGDRLFIQRYCRKKDVTFVSSLCSRSPPFL